MKLLSQRLPALTDNGKRKLLLNLANLTQMATGIRAIVESHVCLQRQHDKLKLLGPRGQVLESVDFVSLARHHSQL